MRTSTGTSFCKVKLIVYITRFHFFSVNTLCVVRVKYSFNFAEEKEGLCMENLVNFFLFKLSLEKSKMRFTACFADARSANE